MGKKLASRIICVFLMVLLLPLAVFAEEGQEEKPWSEAYYRCGDFSGGLSNAEIKSMDGKAIDFITERHLDFVEVAVTEEKLASRTEEEYGFYYYEKGGFGYGDTRDGFMCVYNVDTGALVLLPMGTAEGILTGSSVDKIISLSTGLLEKHGLYGVMYGVYLTLGQELDALQDKEMVTGAPEDMSASFTGREQPDVPEQPEDTGIERLGEGKLLPPWFPADIGSFAFYSDPDAPRVVDMAGIFTETEKTLMAQKIAHIAQTLDRDVVVVTDISSYGLGEAVYAADFYDYNGYGFGTEREGLCLFLCMDPNDRGGWVCATGSLTRELYSRFNANRLDDALYEVLGQERFGEAVLAWLDNVEGMLRTGLALAPDWYPVGGRMPEPFHNPDAALVTDDSGLLSAEERESLTAGLEKIRAKHGVTMYLHLTDSFLGMDTDRYAALLHRSLGLEKNCVLLLVRATESGDTGYDYMYVYGDVAQRVKPRNVSRMQNHISTQGSPYHQLERAVKLMETFLRTGRVPRTMAYWGFISALGAFVGFIYGRLTTDAAENGMRNARLKTEANDYVDHAHTIVRILFERFLYTKTSSVRIATPSSSSGSSSGHSSSGRSTYHSSYSGHSGASHSGSGRKF